MKDANLAFLSSRFTLRYVLTTVLSRLVSLFTPPTPPPPACHHGTFFFLMQEAESVAAVTCLSLFTRFERLSLERIVGEERTKHMLASSKNTFLFC